MRYWSQWLRAWSLAAGLLLSACALPQADTGTSAYNRGLLAYQAGYYGLAAEELRQAVNQDPISIPALNALGAAYDQIGRYDLAQRQYQRALAVDPTSSQTLNNIGYSYLLQNRPDVAAVYLRDAHRYSTAPEITATLSANLKTAERALDDNTARPSMQARAPITDEPSPRIRRLTGKIQTMQTLPEPVTPPVIEAKPAPRVAEVEALASPRPPGTRPIQPKPQTRQQAAALSHPLPISRPAIETPIGIEISNGADRLHMGERLRDYLQGRGQTITLLSEAPHHSYRRSIIYYRSGHDAAAAGLQQTLAPASLELLLEQRDGQRADVTLRLGNDLLVFDKRLYEQAASGASRLARAKSNPEAAPAPRRALLEARLSQVGRADGHQDRPRVRIEVANGTGRTNMAARISDHLSTGAQVFGVTNATSFDHQASHITHRPNARAAAAALRDVLPGSISIRESTTQHADVKLTLGADLIDLDRQLAAQQVLATIEVSNGAGRNRMAANMRAYLRHKGFTVRRITNASHFHHETTTIYYRSGHRASAQELAATVPVPVRLLEDRAPMTDLRLEMGYDLLGLDLAGGERPGSAEPG